MGLAAIELAQTRKTILFTFDEAPAAHHYIHDRKAIGKVLLIP